MLKNYIKVAWRNLVRNKTYSLINTVGLSVGVASCLLIVLFIQDELNYDRYHEKSDRIYRVNRQNEFEGKIHSTLATSNALGPALKNDIPGIVNSMRLSKRWPEVLVEQGSTKFYDEKFFFADPSIFEMFSFQMIRGNPATALERAFTIVLSEDMARKYFGDRNPIGKTLSVQGFWGADEYEVTGVIENTPHNSHFSINFLTSIETLRIKEPGPADDFESWNYIGTYTYVLLGKEVAPENLTDDFNALISRYQGEEEASDLDYVLQPITDIHLYSHFEREIEPNSDVRYLYIFGSIALLILIIAGINYTNLATARSAERATEVGIRKTLGVSRSRLAARFLSESLLFCSIAIVLALLLVKALLPYFNDLTGKALSLELFNPLFSVSLICLLLLVGLLAGVYPALLLSRFKPQNALSGLAGGRKKSALRNTLVVFQFALSIALIVGTLVINNQLDHVRNKRLGLNDEHVVSIVTDSEFRKNYGSFKDKLLSHTNISSVTSISPILPSTTPQAMALEPEGRKPRNVNFYFAGDDFIRTLDIPLKTGQDISDLSSRISNDSTGGQYAPVLINEAAVKEWGWEDPLGKTFGRFKPTPMVAGVVEDFHYRSLKEQIEPLVIFPFNTAHNVLIRIKPENIPQTISYIQDSWNEMGPGTLLDYTFLNDRFDSMYKAEDRMAGLFESFTLLAIFIACLGLLGLAAYTAERRTKEIGIRKVLGATLSNIVLLLSKDFMKLVLIGFIIAVPISWYAMNRWLQDFAYRIEIGFGLFAIAGGAALLIALVTVSWQATRAAQANPVDSLRNE